MTVLQSCLLAARRVVPGKCHNAGIQRYMSTESLKESAKKCARGGIADRCRSELEAFLDAGTYKNERVIASPQSTHIRVTLPFDKKSNLTHAVLNFCANNYLGLANHPRVVEAAHQAIDDRGYGLSSVRFICGTQDMHKDLEELIANFHGTDDAILHPSCFDANAGVFEALLGPEDAVISDELNHASLIDGIRLCKAERHKYRHSDMGHLEEILQKTESTAQNRLIVSDGVFSMDGNIANLQEICHLADKYDANILIDDCHATGVLGRTGRGTVEHCGVEGRVDIITSTLGKALGGGNGGYVAGPKPIVELLRQKSRPYLFSNSLAPAIVGAAIESFRILEESNAMVERLAENIRYFRSELEEAGFCLAGDDRSAIVPIMIGDAKLANDIAEAMLQRGIYVIGFSYPVVPKGEARIRVQLSADHTHEDVHKAINAFVEVGKMEGIIDRKYVID